MSSKAPRRRWRRWLGAAALLLVLGSVAGSGQETAEQSPPAETQEPEPSPTASSPKAPPETEVPAPEPPPPASPETEQPGPPPAPPPEQTAQDVLGKHCGDLNRKFAALLLETLWRVDEVNWSDLPPEFLDQGPGLFEKLQKNFAECLSRAEAVADLGGGQSAVFQKVLDVVRRGHKAIGEVLRVFEREALLRDHLTARLAALVGIAELPLAPTEWPPPDLCAACPDLWKALDKVQRLLREAGRGPGPPRARLDATADSMKAIYAQRKALCDPRLTILAVRPDVLDAPARYYSWTQSWQSFREIRDRLSDPAFAEWCRP